MTYLQQLTSQLLALLVERDDSTFKLQVLPSEASYESHVEMWICKTTDMTPVRWATLDEAARTPWLEEAIRVLSSKKTTTPSGDKKQPKAKPGRKSNPEQDESIAKQYESGLEDGLWIGQADYLRKKHQKRSGSWNAKKAWLSNLLKRVSKRRELKNSERN